LDNYLNWFFLLDPLILEIFLKQFLK